MATKKETKQKQRSKMQTREATTSLTCMISVMLYVHPFLSKSSKDTDTDTAGERQKLNRLDTHCHVFIIVTNTNMLSPNMQN